MTLMPVSNSSRFGSRVSKAGARAVDVPPVLDALERVDVEGLAEHVEHVAEHGVADRHLHAVAEVAHRRRRGVRPSVGFRQMARTRPSPICWATSARTSDVVALDGDRHLEGGVDLGQGAAGELDVDDRAGDGDDPAVLQLLGLSVGASR